MKWYIVSALFYRWTGRRLEEIALSSCSERSFTHPIFGIVSKNWGSTISYFLAIPYECVGRISCNFFSLPLLAAFSLSGCQSSYVNIHHSVMTAFASRSIKATNQVISFHLTLQNAYWLICYMLLRTHMPVSSRLIYLCLRCCSPLYLCSV